MCSVVVCLPQMRQQKEYRLFAENAIGIMRADQDRWDALIDSVRLLHASPRVTVSGVVLECLHNMCCAEST